jgi:hypothetical protein
METPVKARTARAIRALMNIFWVVVVVEVGGVGWMGLDLLKGVGYRPAMKKRLGREGASGWVESTGCRQEGTYPPGYFGEGRERVKEEESGVDDGEKEEEARGKLFL